MTAAPNKNKIDLPRIKRTIKSAKGLLDLFEALASEIQQSQPPPATPPGPDFIYKEQTDTDSDPYHILGISFEDSNEMLDAVFRAKAKLLHPDHGGDAERFKELMAAYNAIRTERGLN